MSCMAAPTLANVPMTPSKYTLPPPIYLPSSGGYTSSRFVEDVSGLNVIVILNPRLNGFSRSLFTNAFSRIANTVLTKMGGSCVGRGARTVNRVSPFPLFLSCFNRLTYILAARNRTTARRDPLTA